VVDGVPVVPAQRARGLAGPHKAGPASYRLRWSPAAAISCGRL
jgi:hypothetical protein